MCVLVTASENNIFYHDNDYTHIIMTNLIQPKIANVRSLGAK